MLTCVTSLSRQVLCTKNRGPLLRLRYSIPSTHAARGVRITFSTDRTHSTEVTAGCTFSTSLHARRFALLHRHALPTFRFNNSRTCPTHRSRSVLPLRRSLWNGHVATLGSAPHACAFPPRHFCNTSHSSLFFDVPKPHTSKGAPFSIHTLFAHQASTPAFPRRPRSDERRPLYSASGKASSWYSSTIRRRLPRRAGEFGRCPFVRLPRRAGGGRGMVPSAFDGGGRGMIPPVFDGGGSALLGPGPIGGGSGMELAVSISASSNACSLSAWCLPRCWAFCAPPTWRDM